MKADVTYNDFIGTVAADISDHTDLNEFLKTRGVDTHRYEAIGASFYAGYEDFFTGSIICLDKEQSTADKPYTVEMSFENEITQEQFFSLFKRLNVVFTLKHSDYGQRQKKYTDGSITIDDTGTEK
jgi:uncharacterized protein YjbK